MVCVLTSMYLKQPPFCTDLLVTAGSGGQRPAECRGVTRVLVALSCAEQSLGSLGLFCLHQLVGDFSEAATCSSVTCVYPSGQVGGRAPGAVGTVGSELRRYQACRRFRHRPGQEGARPWIWREARGKTGVTRSGGWSVSCVEGGRPAPGREGVSRRRSIASLVFSSRD